MTDEEVNFWYAALLIINILFLLIFFIVATGCVTAAKNTYRDVMATPTPTPTPTPPPTEIPTVTPTPTPAPTESIDSLMARTNGYHQRDWLHWFRPDVQGINGQGTKDLSCWVTTYNWSMFPNYHYHSVSWGTTAFFKETPAPGMKYLFVFVNYYCDGDDVRPYIFGQEAFQVFANGVAYQPEDIYNPDFQIRELDNLWDYAHREDPNVPYGYKVIQDVAGGSGIISAVKQDIVYEGRSNAIDGYLVFQVPEYETAQNITVHGSFANLGGQAWWQLE